ncbi:MAG: beta-lactamase family protein [Gemmatimonadota bacterium]|nr:MAG: beta-lactamase family protein [Gemmatimonadota bacterium]
MKRSRLLACSLIGLVGVQSCSTPSDPADPFPAVALQTVLDAALEEYDGIGVSASVLVPGEQLWSGTSGISHGETAISPGMLFLISSITKTYTSATVLQLVEEGTLSLNDPLHSWLPSHPNIDSTITIRQLLDHTSGVFDYYEHPAFFDSIMADPAREWAPEQTLRFVLEPSFSPGADWDYSNTNYILLGMIIEEATGTTVAEEFRGRFLTPLRLRETFMAVEEELGGTVAHGWYDIDGDEILDDVIESMPMTAFMSMEWTAGAMFSSSRDLARWTDALFGGEVVSQASLDDMLTFHPLSIPGSAYSGYGLGVGSFVIAGHQAYGHGGETPGYRSLMVYLPQSGVSIAVLMNQVNGACLFAAIEGLVQNVQDYLGG